MGLGVMLTMLRAFALEMFETVMSGFVAGPGAFTNCLDMLVHFLVLVVCPRHAGARQQERRGPASHQAQQFSTIHDGLLVSRNSSIEVRTLPRRTAKQLSCHGELLFR
jgi:hypothetical protein